MISYFPTPYENELLYSLIARYHYHSGHQSKRETLLKLFGHSRRFDVDLPKGIDSIVKKLKDVSNGLTTDYFIEQHTILPLFRHFMEPTRYQKVLLKVKGQNEANFSMRVIRESDDDVRRKDHLYYCKKCLKEQFETYGEGFWNRFHQIPGVCVCTKHKICLTKLPRYNIKKHWNNFILPNIDDVQANVQEIQVSNHSLEVLIDIAKDIEYVFSGNLTSQPYNYYFDKYMELLKINGIGYPMIKRRYLLAEKILDFYPKEVLELLNSYIGSDNPLSWTRYITEKGRIKNLHPVRHILVMRLFCGNIREFYKNNYTYQPFGSGPWICMNPLADHYLEKCIENIEVGTHVAYRILRGDFTCKCGFKYRLIFPEKNPLEVAHFSQRIIRRGEIWYDEFQKLLSKNLNLTDISRIIKVSPPTVRRIKEQIYSGKQNENIRRGGRSKEMSIEEKTQKYKDEWVNIFKQNQKLNRTQLKALNIAAYSWIQKYDKEWLEKYQPPVRYKHKYSNQYYIKMDNKFLLNAKEVISNWTVFEGERGGLQRITKNALFKQMGITSGVLRDKGNNYPLFQEFVDSVVETKEDFQMRRIKHVLENKFSNKRATIAKIKMLTSLYQGLNPEVAQYLKEKVYSHNKQISNVLNKM